MGTWGTNEEIPVSNIISLNDYSQAADPQSRLCQSYMEMSPTCPTFNLKTEDYVRMDQVYPGAGGGGGQQCQHRRAESLPSHLLTSSQDKRNHLFGRLFKKANRHKADYVFVDFERDNYVEMNRIPDRNWKFLAYFPRNKKNSC